MNRISTAFQIKVPGSTANLGPGFDSIGLAVNRYLTLQVQRTDKWSFLYSDQPNFNPPLKENLIYRTADGLAKRYGLELPACRVDVRSDIPLARGLGSSGAAIIAGIELTDQLLSLNLDIPTKEKYACMLEGHPDNVSASLHGGLIVAYQNGSSVDCIRLPAPDFDFVTLIPNFELKTREARKILPETLPFGQAIAGSAVANVLICALLGGNGPLAGKMMESDLFHQPFRSGLLPHFSKAAALAGENGAFGTFLSGAGPTLMSLADSDHSRQIHHALTKAFPDYECLILHSVAEGSCCTPKL